MSECHCRRNGKGVLCLEAGQPVKVSKAKSLTFCVAKAYLLPRMPHFDQYYLPPSVTVDGSSMFDDNIAFALMANNASKFSERSFIVPLQLCLGTTRHLDMGNPTRGAFLTSAQPRPYPNP